MSAYKFRTGRLQQTAFGTDAGPVTIDVTLSQVSSYVVLIPKDTLLRDVNAYVVLEPNP